MTDPKTLTDEEIRQWASHTDTALVVTRIARALLQVKQERDDALEDMKVLKTVLRGEEEKEKRWKAMREQWDKRIGEYHADLMRAVERAEQAEHERDEARQGEKDACAITGRLARELGEEHAARKGAEREAEAVWAVVEAAKRVQAGWAHQFPYLNEALAAFRVTSGKGER